MTPRSVVFAFAALLLATPPGLAAQEQQEPTPSLTVAGVGEVSVAPDVVEIDAGVVTEAREAAAAMRASSEVMQRLLAALTSLGIASKDVRTQQIDLSPRYRHDPERRSPPRIEGYQARSRLHVTVREIARVGAVLDRLVAEGANEMGGIAFSVAEPTPLLDEARRRAVVDARRKAELYSRAAGVKLGRLLRLEEHAPGPVPLPRMAARAESMGVPVAPGELDLNVRITVTYALE